jgi:hypothetical protein
MRNRDLAAIATTIVALAVFVTGCGSSNKTTTGSSAESQQVWANGVCNSFLTWESSLRSAGQKLQGGQLSKAALRQAAGDARAANTQLVSSVNNLGKPPTPAAAQAKSIVQNLENQLKSAVAEVKNTASSASAAQAVSVARQQITKMSTEVSSAVRQLQSLKGQSSWKKAFSNAKSCQALAKS